VAAVVGVLVNVWLERKISAAVQQRIGPEYAGALGILQPLADGLKLLFKEDIIPARADGLLFTLGPVLVLVPVILSWLVVPFGQNLLISNVGVGIFLWISLSSIQPIGLLMAGYASNNKYSLLGGLRAAAQSISYEIPLALAVLAIVMMSNSLSTVDIVNQQTGAGILSWNIWRQPVGFLIFWICALAECERLPFDLPEAEEELVAGYQTEYAGMKFALFYLGSYINLVLSALLVAVLYLGGWGFPLPVEWIVQLTGQPIDAPLVQVITAKSAHPSLDWLNFVATPTARNRIRQWYKKSHREENIQRGTAMLERELGRDGFDALLHGEAMVRVARRCNLVATDDLLAAIGYADPCRRSGQPHPRPGGPRLPPWWLLFAPAR